MDANLTRKSCFGRHSGGKQANICGTIECSISDDVDACVDTTMANLNASENSQLIVDGAALVKAANDGYTNKVQDLLAKGVPLTVTDSMGLTPLMRASREGHAEIVRCLIEAGADVNQPGFLHGPPALFQVNALGFASSCFGTPELVKLLLDAGADPNEGFRNSYGETISYPLIDASRRGDVEVVKLLLDAGADVNAVGSDNFSALKVACEQGVLMKDKHKKKFKRCTEIVRLLLAAGAK